MTKHTGHWLQSQQERVVPCSYQLNKMFNCEILSAETRNSYSEFIDPLA